MWTLKCVAASVSNGGCSVTNSVTVAVTNAAILGHATGSTRSGLRVTDGVEIAAGEHQQPERDFGDQIEGHH